MTEGYERITGKYAWESAAFYWTKPILSNGNSIKDEIDILNEDRNITKKVYDNGEKG